MKVENMVKLKEEFDYKSLCRRLETDLDRLIAENERQSQAVLDAEEEMDQKIAEAQHSVMEAEKKLATTLEVISCLQHISVHSFFFMKDLTVCMSFIFCHNSNTLIMLS